MTKDNNQEKKEHRSHKATAVNKSNESCVPIMLTQLNNGASAKITELKGGHLLTGKLEAMGILPGTTITKSGSSIMKGPIVLKKGTTQLAIGYAMAQLIMVDPCIL